MFDLKAIPDFGLEWLDASGPSSDVVLSTRVRLARNLQGFPFSVRAKNADREAVLGTVRQLTGRDGSLRDAWVVSMRELDVGGRRLLLERHLVSRDLTGEEDGAAPPAAALVLARNAPLGCMINEEDHLRLQVLSSGFQPVESWRAIDRLDEEIGARIPFAFHHEFGYLTSCPTNCGTGLRASVLIHLPGLVLTKEIHKVLHGLTQVGLTFRGLYGEGSEVVGNFFQVSNQTTLGKTEEDLIDHLQKMVRQVMEYESRARSILLRDAPTVIEDKVWRAYGILRHARNVGFDEVMNLLSGVRLGLSLKLLPGPSVYALNRIMIFSQNAHLELMAGQALGPNELDVHRAAYVRELLAEEEERWAP
ncbi:MAG: ATP--guanido phosphotransferase [Gemmatimonadota bacterium]